MAKTKKRREEEEMGVADFSKEDEFMTGCAVYDLATGELVSLFGQKILVNSTDKFSSISLPGRTEIATLNMAEIMVWDYLKGILKRRYQIPPIDSHLNVVGLLAMKNLLVLCRYVTVILLPSFSCC